MTVTLRFVDNCPQWARESIERALATDGIPLVEVDEQGKEIRTAVAESVLSPILRALGTDRKLRKVWDRLKEPFEVNDLAGACWWALQPTDGLTAADRRESAQVVARHANALAKELRRRLPDTDWQNHVFPRIMARFEAIDGVNPYTAAAVYLSLESLLPELLNAMTEGSLSWSADSPRKAHPNDPNAGRTLFYRELERFMIDTFGDPHRDVILVLASQHFDVSDQTVESVKSATRSVRKGEKES